MNRDNYYRSKTKCYHQPRYIYQDKLLNKLAFVEVQDYTRNDDGTVTSYDPRLYDVQRGLRMKLDRPSVTSSIPISSIYTNECGDYDQFSVNNGQITYYIDNEIKGAYYKPVYDIPADTIPFEYVDPMTSWKPHYILAQDSRDIDNYSVLSSINDSSFHRENLIASQQAKFNQTRITPFY